MKVRVRFMAILKPLAGKPYSEVEVDEQASLLDVILRACNNNSKLIERLFSDRLQSIKPDIIVLVDGVDVNVVGDLKMSIKGVREVTLIPSVHGG
ncbi:MAG: hypothetical protein DRJ68_00545 [Thermoprotei archaeon]|nr:MAG: hypothetical protein DRJ68_00545 [Thermoprotei archaeon]